MTLQDKARKSDGLSTRCNSCSIKNLCLVDKTINKVCTNSYQEGYIKGYKQAKRDKNANK